MHVLVNLLPISFPIIYFFSRYVWGRTRTSFRLIYFGYLLLVAWCVITLLGELRERDYGNVIILSLTIILTMYLVIRKEREIFYGFVPRTVSLMVSIYFPLKLLDDVLHLITYTVAYLTFTFAKTLLNAPLALGSIEGDIFISGVKNTYYFTFACTGFQSIAIITSPMIATLEKVCIKKALFISLAIYFLNVIRSFAIVFLVDGFSWDYYLVHTILMKIFSILVMLGMFYYVLSTCKPLVDEVKRLSRVILPKSRY